MMKGRLRSLGFAVVFSSCGGALHAEPPAPVALASAAEPQPNVMGVGLTSSELDRSVRFYRDGLGMVELRRIPLGDIDEVIMGFDGRGAGVTVFLLGPRTGTGPAVEPSPHDKLVVSVSDAQALSARLSGAGYKPGPIKSNPQFRIRNFFVSDPDGHRIEIVQKDAG